MKLKLPMQFLYDTYRRLIRHPKLRWWVIAGTLLYVLSPIDFAPDAIPFLGEIDDALLLTVMIAEVSQTLIEQRRTLQQTKKSAPASQPVDTTPIDVKAVRVS